MVERETTPQPRQPIVLLVEDDVLIRAALGEELRLAELSVIEAATADEAWSYLQAGGRADLIFSDVEMPGSINGIDLARRIKASDPAVTIILSSGKADTASIGNLAPLFPKPYRLREAVSLILGTLQAK